MEFKLKDLIDIALFQELQEKLNQIYSFPTAIIDSDGNVLTTTGLLDICTKFHRINPESMAHCLRSDKLLSDHLHEKNPIGLYKCPHGMTDYTIPIVIEGHHLGVFCTGQCFLEPPNLNFFRDQARKYDFEEKSYLEAVSRVPLLTMERLEQYISVAKSFTEILAGIGYKNLKEIRERKILERTKEDLRQSEVYLHELSEGVPGYICIFSPDFKIIYCNDALVTLSGQSAEDITGHCFFDFLESKEKEYIKGKLMELTPENHTEYHQQSHLDSDGKRHYEEWRNRAIFDNGGKVSRYLSIGIDITERKLAEEKIIKTKRIYEVTSKINQAIVRLRERDKLLKEVCSIAIDIGKFQMAWIGFFEEELKIVKPYVFAGNENGYLTVVRQISVADRREGRGPTGRAIEDGRYSVCNDIENDPRMEFWREEALKRNYRSSIALPLKSFGKVLGAYSLYSSTPRFFDQQEIDLLNEVAENISYALEAIESEEERKKAELELLAAKELAEESVRLKSAFLNNMSHEIRTPMNAIMGFSNLLVEAEGEEKNQYAEIVQKSSVQLLRLIDDVMLLSRLQSEKLPLHIVGFYPSELVADVYNLFNLPEVHLQIEFSMAVPAQHIELRIRSDVDKIKQALAIFIANALKYTPEGSVEVGFDVENENIRFYVKDTGLGVSEKEQQLIFDTFYRGEQVLSSAIRGTGLGLNIARELVDLLDGKIGLNSEPDKGSIFYLTIPLEKLDLVQGVSNTPPTPETDCKEFVILIAEDEPDNFHYLEILLKTKVKRIDHAFNGEEAVKLAKENLYNLILMDLKMPVMGGLEATAILKQMHPAIPVIAQSAYSQSEEKKAAIEAGCDNYMVKPIKKSDLLEMLSRYGKRDEI